MPVALSTQREQEWALRWGWLIIALAVLAAYWPLTSFQWTVGQGDTLNCWLPWRWFIASSLHDGRFPLWNPHQQFGYPMHADMQGPSWYVEAIALGGTIGHGVRVLQGLFLLYLMIGGWGMMRLTRTIHGDARAGLIIGLAYALGGFLTAHQQHFYAIISAAWLPWLLHAFIRLLREPGWRTAARVALIQGLLLTGGNHTFTIIGAYVLMALFGLHAITAWRGGRWTALKPLLAWSAAAAIGAAVVGAGALHAWWDASAHLARHGALPYDTAAYGAVERTALISLLFPFAPGSDFSALGVDPSMANLHMGAIIAALAAAALLRRTSALERFFLAMGVLCAVISLGDATPVHRLVWNVLPGMDVFRFPSYLHLFTWIAVLTLAGGSITALLNGSLPRWRLVLPIAAMLGAAAILAVLAASGLGADGEGVTLYEHMRAMHPARRVLLNAAVVLPVLTIAVLAAWRGRMRFTLLLGLVAVEMCWGVALAQWNTAISDFHPAWLARRLAAQNEGPVVPDPRPTSSYDDNGSRLRYLAHGTQDFIGGFSRNGVNSFWLRNAMDLEVRHTALWDAMARQPVAYLAERIIPYSAYAPDAIDAARDSGLAVVMDGAPFASARHPSSDDSVSVTGFDRDSFTMACILNTPRLLVLQQSHYPGWSVAVDGTPGKLLRVNLAAMAAEIPAGEHTVTFRYAKPLVPWLLALSLLTFFALLSALAWSAGSRLALVATAALAGMVCWSLFANTSDRSETNELMRASRERLPDNASVILNDDGTSDFPTVGDMVGWGVRADEPTAVGRAWTVLNAAKAHRTSRAPVAEWELHWFDAALKADPAVRAMILDRWDAEVIARRGRSMHLRLTDRALPLQGRVLLAPDTLAPRWLSSDSPYGGGITFALDSVADLRDGCLVVDLLGMAPRSAKAMVVLERKAGERTTEYLALPIAAEEAERPAYAVQPLDEIWRPGESLKIYVWSHQGDSLRERALRIRAVPKRFHAW